MKARLTSLFVVFLVAALLLGVGGTAVLAQPQSPGQPGDKPAGKSPVPPVEIIADRDGDRIFDNLAARLSALPDDHSLPVIVLFDRPVARVDLPAMQRQLGGFAVGHRFAVVDGISATLTKGQIRAASHMPFVTQVEYDLPVQAVLDGATEWFGVDAASAEWGVNGDADGNASYSKNDVVIAVVDTGIDPNHVDLDGGKIIGWKDIILDRSDPYDDRGHGTHVASIAAGTGEGSNGRYAGVAPGAALVGVKVLDANGSGTESQVLAGIDWVVDNKDVYGIEVMNMSLGAVGSSDGNDALSQAVNAAAANGIVPVIAAGNSGPWRYTVGTPGAAAGALTVGAMADVAELGFNLASFSSRGPTADGRIKPDIAAPGYQITAAQSGTGSGYVAYSGTSMATPFTAGVVALVLDRNPNLTVSQVKSLLQQTAVDWGPTGADNEYGAGRLDALAAIGAAASGTSPSGPAVPAHLYFGDRLTTQGGEAFHELVVSDTTKPLALTLVVANATCAFSFWGMCWEASADYDLELLDPNGQLVASSVLPDRQDTINVMPAKTGTYRARVYVCDSCGYNDDYWLDVSLGAASSPPGNSAPTANGNAYAVAEDAILTVAAPGVLGNDSDPDGDPLTAVLVGSPANGAVTLNANGSFTYTPNADFNGNDSFSYRANDGSLNSNVATVVVTVNPVNDPPVAQNLVSSTNEDASVGIVLSASDPEGDPLTYSVVSQPANGTLTGAAPTLTYTPAPDYYGSDSFTYKASDGSADSNIVTVNISVSAVNDPPSFVKGADQQVAEDAGTQSVAPWATAISAGPANEADQTLTFQVTNDNNALFGTQPAVSSNGTLSYTPAANAHGSATVTVTLRDNGGTANGGDDSSDPQTFQIAVSPVNDAPVAVDDSYGTNAGTPLTISAPGVLANDNDVDGDSLTAVLVTGPGNGTLALNADGSFTYTPNAGYSGPDSFTYQASDGSTVSDTATVSIMVNAVAGVSISSVNPTSARRGEQATIWVYGSGFQPGATVTFGERVTVQSVTISPDGTVITARIRVHPKANLGPRDVIVTNPDGTGDTLEGGFTVL